MNKLLTNHCQLETESKVSIVVEANISSSSASLLFQLMVKEMRENTRIIKDSRIINLWNLK